MDIFLASMSSAPSPAAVRSCTNTSLLRVCKRVFVCPQGTVGLSSSLWSSLIIFSICIFPTFCTLSDQYNKVSSCPQTLAQFLAVILRLQEVYSFIIDNQSYLLGKNTKHSMVAASQI